MKKMLSKPWMRYLSAFFAPVVLYGLVMLIRGVIPFGDRTLLFWDADGQYAAFLAALRRMLLGEEDWLYSFSRVLGDGVAGVFAYYLASPVNLLMALFSPTQLPLAFSVIVLVKMGLCSLSLFHYARRAYHAGLCGLLFAVSYALMGYMAVYFWDIMWLDALALLPLIVLGIDRLTEGKAPFLYLLTLALGLYCNYYIGLMLCLFSVLYFLYRLLVEGLAHRLTAKDGVRRAGRFALASLLAGGAAAALLLPTLFSLQGGHTIWWDTVLSLKQDASLRDVFTKLYTGAVSFQQLRYGLPNIFVGMPMLALAGVYLLHPAIPKGRKLAAVGLLGVFLLSFTIHLFYMIWHGLDAPNCMPARFSFLFCFLLIDLALQGYLALRRSAKPFPKWRGIGMGAAFLAITCFLFRSELPEYLVYETVVLDVLAFIAACGAVLLLSRGRACRAAIAALCLIQAGGLMLNAYLGASRSEVVDNLRASTYAQTIEDVSGMIDRVRVEDNGLYRMEKNFARSENDPLLYGYNGLSHYSSDNSLQFNRFVSSIGLEQVYLGTMYRSGTTPVLNSLFSVKYLLWRTGGSLIDAPEGFTALWTEGDVTAYENPTAMPMAYLVPAEATADPLATENPFENQNALLTDITGTPTAVFTPVTGAVRTTDGDWTVYTIPVAAGERLYMHVSGAYFCWNGGGMEDRFRFGGCVALPVRDEAQQCELKLILTDGMTPSFNLYRFDPEAWARTWELLEPLGCDMTAGTASRLSLRTGEQSPGGQLLLTIPYDAGWGAWVDGVPQPITPRYDTLLALNLAPGAHEIELRYIPQGLIPGVVISIACLLAAGCWWVFGWRISLRRRRDSPA